MKPYIRTIPITTSATPDYSIGDCVGTTFKIEPQAFSGQGIKLQTLVATDQSNQGPALRILFFGAQPTGTYTDNAAMDLSAADLTNIIGQIKISAADWETTDSYKFVSLSSLQLILGANVGNADRAIYGTIVADTVWNAAATNDLYLHIGFEE